MTPANAKCLDRLGITDVRLRDLAVKKIPCGETSIEEVLKDDIPWQTNAPRALCICWYKGYLAGLATLPKEE